jgi:hypothetical protein
VEEGAAAAAAGVVVARSGSGSGRSKLAGAVRYGVFILHQSMARVRLQHSRAIPTVMAGRHGSSSRSNHNSVRIVRAGADASSTPGGCCLCLSLLLLDEEEEEEELRRGRNEVGTI